jgi:periplasmic copper chaperone A
MLRTVLSAAVAACLTLAALTLPALAHEGLHVEDPYVRVTGPSAQSGAAFMTLTNHTDTDRRLIAARSDVAQRVELHTHAEDAQGVMRMIHVTEGFVIPAQGERVLDRGGDHVMFLGLTRSLSDGDLVVVTLVFDDGVDQQIEVQIPVDTTRMPATGHGHSHGHSRGHSHGHSHGN